MKPTKEIIMKITKNIGILLLGVWFILPGMEAFVPAVGRLWVILSFLGVAAGVFYIMEK